MLETGCMFTVRCARGSCQAGLDGKLIDRQQAGVDRATFFFWGYYKKKKIFFFKKKPLQRFHLLLRRCASFCRRLASGNHVAVDGQHCCNLEMR